MAAQDRNERRLARLRMARTGEKYTQALRTIREELLDLIENKNMTYNNASKTLREQEQQRASMDDPR